MSARDVAQAALNAAPPAMPYENGNATATKTQEVSKRAHAINISNKLNNSRPAIEPLGGVAMDEDSVNNTAQTSQNSQPQPDSETPASSAFSSQNLSQSSQPPILSTSIPELSVQILTTRPRRATIAGQKRTVDGLVRRISGSSRSSDESSDKTANASERTSTTSTGYIGVSEYKRRGHSRNPSAVSIASSAMSPRELTSELRTRLSYAMVKVQKGWESLPICEVETLASKSASPASETMNGRRGSALTSPRSAIGRGHSMDGLRDPVVVSDYNGQQMNGNANGNGRTYESFWRSTVQRTNMASPPSSQPANNAHLQPPAEVRSSSHTANGSHFRRSSPPKSSQPQRRLGQSRSDLGPSSLYSPGTPRDGSSTPVQGGLHTPREQIQKQTTTQSLQEQDAIQTLLLMGSPGNHLHGNFSQLSSQQHQNNHVPPQGSPLKTDYHQRQDYSSSQQRINPLQAPTSSQRSRILDRPRSGRMRDEDIEAMIDHYRGESSDEEVEIIIPPKRIAPTPKN